MRLSVLAILLAGVFAFAQNSKQQPAAPPAEDYSGMYTFLQDGEFVQINIEQGNRLTGFVSRYSDGEKALFLDHFFDKGEIHPPELRFTTKKVHGVWFDFNGSIGRGPGKTPNEEGYYVMRGILKQYTSDANQAVTAKQREVTFKSFPADIESDHPPKK